MHTGLECKRCGFDPALRTIFPIPITLTTLIAMTMILYKLHAVWLLNQPCVHICKVIARVYVIVSIKKTYYSRGMSVVVCTDPSGKELHRQIGVGRSGSLGRVIVSTLAWNARDLGSIPFNAQYFPFLSAPTLLLTTQVAQVVLTLKKPTIFSLEFSVFLSLSPSFSIFSLFLSLSSLLPLSAPDCHKLIEYRVLT